MTHDNSRIKADVLRELINSCGDIVIACNRMIIAKQSISDKGIEFSEDDDLWVEFPHLTLLTVNDAIASLTLLEEFMNNGNRAKLSKTY